MQAEVFPSRVENYYAKLHPCALPCIDAHVAWGTAEPAAPDQKTLAAKLHGHMSQLQVALATAVD